MNTQTHNYIYIAIIYSHTLKLSFTCKLEFLFTNIIFLLTHSVIFICIHKNT